MEAIYDRNIIDVQIAKARIKRAYEVGFNNLLDESKEEWLTGLKGCLNYTDLNRIELNCKTLSDIFNLDLFTKTNWTVADAFNARLSDFERIRNNVEAIRATNYVYSTTPSVPSLPLNRYDKINDIEHILYDVYTMYSANTKVLYYMNDGIYINEQIGVI